MYACKYVCMYVWLVIAGEKWITTAWLREGVTLEENADLFDPEGIKIMAESEYDSNDDQEAGRSPLLLCFYYYYYYYYYHYCYNYYY